MGGYRGRMKVGLRKLKLMYPKRWSLQAPLRPGEVASRSNADQPSVSDQHRRIAVAFDETMGAL